MKSTLIVLSLIFLLGAPPNEISLPDNLEKPIYFRGDVKIANTQHEIVLFLTEIQEVGGGPIHLPHGYTSDRIFVLQQMPGQKKFKGKSQIKNVHLTYFRNVLQIRKENKVRMTIGLGNEALHPDAQERLETITRGNLKFEPYLGLGLAMMPKGIPDFDAFIKAHPVSIYQDENSMAGVDCSKNQEYPGGGHGAMASSVNENTVYCLEEFNACSSTVEARCCTIASTPGLTE